MLLINTIVKQSLITGAGDGLFSKQTLSRSQIIWKRDMSDIGIIKSEYEQLKVLNLVDYIHKYATEEKDGSWFCDGDLCKYINSNSENPNVLFLDYIGVALRDVANGEELTCDYEHEGFTSKEHLKELMKFNK